MRNELSARLASGEEYSPYVDAKIKESVVKTGSHEIVLYDHIQGRFHVKSSRGTKNSSSGSQTYQVNLHEHASTCGKTLYIWVPMQPYSSSMSFSFS